MSVSSSSKRLRFAVLAADVALFTLHEERLWVRVMEVNRPPYFVNRKGLPGGLIRPSETAEEAVLRLIEERAEIVKEKIYSEQLYTFSRPDRDPRGRVVAVAYLALVPHEELSELEWKDGQYVRWLPMALARKLAYDHDEILAVALSRLRTRAIYTTLLQKLMPKEFTLTELERAYETVLGKKIDKRNFRKKIFSTDVLKELPRVRSGGRHRPAKLYHFSSGKVKEIAVL